MPSLSDLPPELVLDQLLPFLPARSLPTLGATSHQFNDLCNDDALWKLKCAEDFNFTGLRTARTSGWMFIYKGLSNPKVYMWGDASRGRLGTPALPAASIPRRNGGIPYPIRLQMPKKAAIVDLIAGGWSFQALDSTGRVFVWGTMDGEIFDLQSDGFSIPQKVSDNPHQLQLPFPVRMLSCGRKHAMALDSSGHIWTFISWGRPYRLVSPLLDCASSDATPAQIECGWGYNSVLAESGDVYVWWPFSEVVRQRNTEMDREGNKRAHATTDGAIPCVLWDLHHNPRRLPALPVLPHLQHFTELGQKEVEETKIIKIAGMDNFLIALTNKGHILKFGDLSNDDSAQMGRWEYLPKFCEAEKVRTHPAFTQSDGNDGAEKLVPPTNFKVTHITAHFLNFVAYSESTVLKGNTNTEPEDDAEIIPALQNKSVISVVLGDYHSAALTSDGKLYTWGSFSRGALGLGLPEELPVGAPGGYGTQEHLDCARQSHLNRVSPVPDVEVPTQVHFDHGEKKQKERFCFAAAAAGWHTGALVIDMNPEDEEEERIEEPDDPEPTARMPGHFDPRGPLMVPRTSPLEAPFFVPQAHAPLSPFRIGFPGRGRRVGRGRGD